MTTPGIAHRRARNRAELRRRARARATESKLDMHGLAFGGAELLIENNATANRDMEQARERILERLQRQGGGA